MARTAGRAPTSASHRCSTASNAVPGRENLADTLRGENAQSDKSHAESNCASQPQWQGAAHRRDEFHPPVSAGMLGIIVEVRTGHVP